MVIQRLKIGKSHCPPLFSEEYCLSSSMKGLCILIGANRYCSAYLWWHFQKKLFTFYSVFVGLPCCGANSSSSGTYSYICYCYEYKKVFFLNIFFYKHTNIAFSGHQHRLKLSSYFKRYWLKLNLWHYLFVYQPQQRFWE